VRSNTERTLHTDRPPGSIDEMLYNIVIKGDIVPFLKSIRTIPNQITPGKYPFTIPAFSKGINIDLKSNVTFFIGENGSGKSTLLEAIADGCGFNLSGGNRSHTYSRHNTESNLSSALRLSWFPKVTDGFFMRAESFFNFATYIDQLAIDDPSILKAYGGKSLHEQSHGESFLSLFVNKFNKGIYVLDEPEAALSPKRQLSFLVVIHELEKSGKAQFLIATHSPIIISYPGSVIFNLYSDHIEEIEYKDTENYRISKEFLENPDRYLRYLFEEIE
jgi:predicted ATPase